MIVYGYTNIYTLYVLVPKSNVGPGPLVKEFALMISTVSGAWESERYTDLESSPQCFGLDKTVGPGERKIRHFSGKEDMIYYLQRPW